MLKFLNQRIIFTLFPFLWTISCFAIHCESSEILLSKEKIKEHIEAFRPTEAIQLSDSILLFIKKNNLGNCKTKLWIQFLKGEGLESNKEYEEALKLYYEILSQAEGNQYWDVVIETYLSIARVHEIINRPVDCKRNLETARKLIVEKSEMKCFSRYAVRYASYNRIFANKDTANIYAQYAIDYGKEYQVDRSQIDGNLLLGILSKDNELSIVYFKNAIQLYLKKGAYYGAASQQSNIISILISEGKLDDALEKIDTMAVYLENMKDKGKGFLYLNYRLYDLKKNIFLKRNNIDSAFVASEASYQFYLKSQQITEQQKINEIEIRNAVEIEKQKALALKKELNYFRIGMMLGLLLFIIIITGSYYILKSRKLVDEKNEIITKQNIELSDAVNKQSTLLTEIHHRVKNNLQNIISLLNLHNQNTNDMPFTQHLNDISSKIRSISLIHEHLYNHHNFTEIKLNLYFEDLFNHMQCLSRPVQQFEYTLVINDISLNIDTTIPLGLIVTELISNSIKYSQKINRNLELSLSLIYSNDEYILTYKDNGIGYMNGALLQNNKSMGAVLIKSMVRQLNGKMESYNNQGAEVRISFIEKQISKL